MHSRRSCLSLPLSLAVLAPLQPARPVASAPTQVRVLPTPGGPQIHVDGVPVVPRWFFGSRRGGTVSAGAEWTQQRFEFSPETEVEGRGTLHFRFGQTPGKVWLADVSLTEVGTGNQVLPPDSFGTEEAFAKTWNVWPPGEANTVGQVSVANGGVEITLAAPPAGKWPDFHLHSNIALSFRAGHTYRCSFRVRAEPARQVRPAVHRVEGGVWTNIGSPPGPFLRQVGLARDVGVRFVSFDAPNCWTPPTVPTDFGPIDEVLRSIIAVHPQVLLVPRVGMNAPPWWLARHPEARMRYEGGVEGASACVSSRAYRADAAAHLEKLCAHLTATFPAHFAGLHPAGQNTGEWFYKDSWRPPLSGYDPATLASWRRWLGARGAVDAQVAEVPTAASRHAAPFGFLRDPAREGRLLDFARFQQEEMADMVLALAAAARRGTKGQKLVVFFYGYNYEFAALPNGAPVSGHYALNRVLQSHDLDLLCSPLSYTDRQWPGTGPCMSPAESIRDAGIMWLTEDDTRTHLDPRRENRTQEGTLVTREQTQELLLRNTAQAALRGFATWWMDLPGQGWFADPALWEVLAKLRPVDEALLHRPTPFTPEVALIVGEDSMCHLTGGSQLLSRPLIYDARAAAGRTGAPYGQYLLTQAIRGQVPAKLQVFLAAWSLTAEQRRELRANRPPGVTRVWCYAPGYLSPDHAAAEDMESVCSFRCRPITVPVPAATPTALGRRHGLTEAWKVSPKVKPLFTVDAADSEVWATYPQGSPAVAIHQTPDGGHEVFVGIPSLTPELLRGLCRLAGVHLFCEEDVALWAAEPYLSIHALATGPLTLDTGRRRPVTDALDGSPLGDGPRVVVPFDQGQTRVLRF